MEIQHTRNEMVTNLPELNRHRRRAIQIPSDAQDENKRQDGSRSKRCGKSYTTNAMQTRWQIKHLIHMRLVAHHIQSGPLAGHISGPTTKDCIRRSTGEV